MTRVGMSEEELQSAIIKAAQFLGWRVLHIRPAMTAQGWRTPISADGKGYPDLTLARDGVVLFLECKSNTNRLSLEQEGWGRSLGPERFAMVRPRDWLSGRVERMLRSGHIEE